jgi:predicted nucleic acid-binding protein
MRRIFVDANVFLRFFTVDDQGQHARAAGLLRDAAAGRLNLVTGPPVLFEIAWTLRSAYRQTNACVLEVIAAIIALPGLELLDARAVADALSLAQASGQEFADAYIAAAAREAELDAVATFNLRHFARLGIALHRF